MSKVRLKIVSGGQTGVDRGALDAALVLGAPCGGWCPAGRRAEDGMIDTVYPLRETNITNYSVRTRRNIADSDGTLVLYFVTPEGGTAHTLEYCRQLRKPYLALDAVQHSPAEAVNKIKQFIDSYRIAILNVAGPRASKQARAGDYTRQTIALLLQSGYLGIKA